MNSKKLSSYPTKMKIIQNVIESEFDPSDNESIIKRFTERPLTLKLTIPWDAYNTNDVVNAVEIACEKLIKSVRCFQ